MKNSDPEKSAVFTEFHEFLSVHKKIIWAGSFRISRQKTAFFAAKTDFHFIFSEIQNLDPEKSPFFVEFHEFL